MSSCKAEREAFRLACVCCEPVYILCRVPNHSFWCEFERSLQSDFSFFPAAGQSRYCRFGLSEFVKNRSLLNSVNSNSLDDSGDGAGCYKGKK